MNNLLIKTKIIKYTFEIAYLLDTLLNISVTRKRGVSQ